MKYVEIPSYLFNSISGSGCRPSGQTYPAVICDGINDPRPPQPITQADVTCVNNIAAGAMLGGAGGGPVGAIGGGLVGSLSGGCYDKCR